MTQTSVFHAGELLVQDRAGLTDDAQRVGRIVQASIVPAAQAFLLDQRMALVGGADLEGQVWVSALFGAPGFLTALDDRTVRIAAQPGPDDPLAEVVGSGARVGMLVIELASRRRMRVNGTVVSVEPDAFTIAASEVFGNCQKYIQRRVFEDTDGVPTDAPTSRAGRELSEAQHAWIAQADTFFIASMHAERGADVSHRGGLPGFVQVVAPTTLVFPDYVGNAMFQTLGNLATHPEAGLLFVDFEGGRTLHLTGRAEILWDDAAERYAPETRRAVRFEIAAVRELAGRAIPPAHLVEYSPFNPAVARGKG
jgi:predicted pyridoxine 5'-phosphate oxidase superfamily flavin-nucleotide-binding protein